MQRPMQCLAKSLLILTLAINSLSLPLASHSKETESAPLVSAKILMGTGAFGKRSTIYISKNGTLIHDNNYNIALMTSAPQFTPYVIDMHGKLYRSFDQLKPNEKPLLRHTELSSKSVNWKRQKDNTYVNQPVQVWRLYTNQAIPILGYWEVFYLQNTPITKPFSAVLSEIHGIPDVQLPPVKLTHVLPGGKEENFIETKWFSNGLMPPDTFILPGDYKAGPVYVRPSK